MYELLSIWSLLITFHEDEGKPTICISEHSCFILQALCSVEVIQGHMWMHACNALLIACRVSSA